MKNKISITRRQAIVSGLASLGGMALAGCSETVPPTYGSILRMGDAFTYHAQRSLLSGRELAREYSYRDISSFPAIGTTNPADLDEKYKHQLDNLFADWSLSVEGLVERPGVYSLSDLQNFTSRKQITRHVCEEGWSAIAEWTGVQLRRVLEHAGIQESARYVEFTAVDGWNDSIDMIDALHPQTILAYGMNGKSLPVPHGAPVRLRVETQIGYKSLKFLQRINVSDTFLKTGDNGWSWHAGI